MKRISDEEISKAIGFITPKYITSNDRKIAEAQFADDRKSLSAGRGNLIKILKHYHQVALYSTTLNYEAFADQIIENLLEDKELMKRIAWDGISSPHLNREVMETKQLMKPVEKIEDATREWKYGAKIDSSLASIILALVKEALPELAKEAGYKSPEERFKEIADAEVSRWNDCVEWHKANGHVKLDEIKNSLVAERKTYKLLHEKHKKLKPNDAQSDLFYKGYMRALQMVINRLKQTGGK